MSNTLDTIQYTLPSSWASYLVNGDASGLEDLEQKEIDVWISRQILSHCTSLFYCADCSEEYFSWRNDANQLGAEVCDYTFLID